MMAWRILKVGVLKHVITDRGPPLFLLANASHLARLDAYTQEYRHVESSSLLRVNTSPHPTHDELEGVKRGAS